jgi:triosephosphate isomerase
MTPKFIVGNWKMHTTIPQAVALAAGIRDAVTSCPHEILIAPPFTALAAVQAVIKGTNLGLGAQNISHREFGPLTGEISVEMLKDIGVNAVIVGHSERRNYCQESDELIGQKIKLALKYQLRVIFCIGENLAQRTANQAVSVVTSQIQVALGSLLATDLAQITIAYEPIWAIGTGQTASPVQACEMHARIRSVLTEFWSPAVAKTCRILYGGSVRPENALELLSSPEIDGVLVGGAALQVKDFTAIAKFDM